MRRGCFRVSSLGTNVMGMPACLCGPVGRCVSSADTSLSLSLSLCPGSTPGLTTDSPRVAVPLVGKGTALRSRLLSGERVMSVGRRRPGVASAPSSSVSMRHGGVRVAEVQRARMLSSAIQVVSEYGYGRMSVARVTGGARVSRRTFYDLFEDREDCFLAVFDDAMARVTASLSGRMRGRLGVGGRRSVRVWGRCLCSLTRSPGWARCWWWMR